MIGKNFDAVHIHSGTIIENAIERQTSLGVQAKVYFDRGLLVPDSIVTTLIMQKLNEPEVAERGYVLDGYPRTKEQANSLIQAGFIPKHVGIFRVYSS